MAELKSTRIYGILNMLYNKITNVATPTDAKDAANKEYVDSHIINYNDPHSYNDSGSSSDWSGVKYKIKIINGKPYLEVVDV